MWVLMCLKNLWSILSLWPKRWCLQGSGIIVGCTASASLWIVLLILGFYLLLSGPYDHAKTTNFSLEVSDQWCLCWAVELSAYLATSLVTNYSCITSSAVSLAPVACTWFSCSVRSMGDCHVTAELIIYSRGRWYPFCFWSHCYLPLLLE